MIAFGIIATLLMAYYAGYLFRCEYYFSRLPANLPEFISKEGEAPHVSIVVAARNEEEHIQACLRDLFSQDYPAGTFEVILVNDHSEDRTKELALETGAGQANFRFLDLENKPEVAFKKAAVAYGIEAAQGEIILVTDADCRMGPNWMSVMVSEFSSEVGMVSGPVLLESKTVFGDLQALEFMGLIAVGAGSIGAGSPNMCNGANLAYRKEAFEEVKGFCGIDQIASGDDELLMHKISDLTDWGIVFAKNPEAVVRTMAHRSWKEFREQRLRWVSKSAQYQNSSITWTLVVFYLAILGLPSLLVLSIFFPEMWPIFWINLGLKVLAEATILHAAAQFFGKLPLMRWLIPEQLLHILYVLWIGIAGNLQSYTWKGRIIK